MLLNKVLFEKKYTCLMLFQFPIDICRVMLEYGTDLLKQRASDSRKYLKYIITQSS